MSLTNFDQASFSDKANLAKIKIPALCFIVFILYSFSIVLYPYVNYEFVTPSFVLLYIVGCLLSFLCRSRGYKTLSNYLAIGFGLTVCIIIIRTFKTHFGVPSFSNLEHAFLNEGIYFQIIMPLSFVGLPLVFYAIYASLNKEDTLFVTMMAIIGFFLISVLIQSTTTPVKPWTYKSYPFALTSLLSASLMFSLSWKAGTKKQQAWMRYIATGLSLLSVGLFLYLFGSLIWLGMKIFWNVLTPNFELTAATIQLEKFIVKVWNFMGLSLPVAFVMSLIGWFVPMSSYRKHWVTDPWKIIINKSRQSKTGHWQGSFMENDKVQQLANNPSGLPLGIADNKKLIRYLPNRVKGWLEGHHAIIAGTRGGKGISAVLPACIEHKGPLFALDIKGELFVMTKNYRAENGKKVVVLNPFEMHGEPTDLYNPISFIRKDHIEEDITTIVDGIVMQETNNEKGSAHFNDIVSDYLTVAIQIAYLHSPKEEQNLVSIIKKISDTDFDATLEIWSNNNDLCNGNAQAIANMILKMGDDERGSFGTTLRRNTKWILNKKMSEMLCESSFSMDEILEGTTDVFIAIPQGMLKDQARFLRLMTNILVATCSRSYYPKKEIFAILDEFCRLGKMNKVLDLATLMAGYNLTALFVIQDKGQLDDIYTQNGAGTILSSCATTRIWALGSTDNITSEYAEKSLPEMTIYSETDRQNGQTDNSLNENRTKILTAPEITKLPVDQMLCFVRSNKPMIIKAIDSTTHPHYKGKIGPRPIAPD